MTHYKLITARKRESLSIDYEYKDGEWLTPPYDGTKFFAIDSLQNAVTYRKTFGDGYTRLYECETDEIEYIDYACRRQASLYHNWYKEFWRLRAEGVPFKVQNVHNNIVTLVYPAIDIPGMIMPFGSIITSRIRLVRELDDETIRNLLG